MGRSKELWMEEEERVEEVMVDLLYECVDFYGENGYEEFEKSVDQFLKDGTIPKLDMRDHWVKNCIKTFDISSDQFNADWYKERVVFLIDEHQSEFQSKYAEEYNCIGFDKAWSDA